jgi:hypothetical protein
MSALRDFLGFNWGSMSIDDKADVLEKVINDTLEQFEDGKITEGTESLSLLLEEVLAHAGILERDVRYQWWQVAAHPCNREGALYVPIDVHDLLKRWMRDGFNPRVWKALACSRPTHELGDKWVERNNEVCNGSDGLLPAFNNDDVKVFTSRGSHGTSAVRVMESGRWSTALD